MSSKNSQHDDESPEPPRKDRPRWLPVVGAVGAVAAIGFIAWGLWLAYRPAPLQLQGMVEAEHLTIATKVPMSRVEKLLVNTGDKVKAGQPVVQLSSPELDARRQQAEGALAGAQALQARALAGSRPENIESLRATADSADAALVLTEKTYARMSNLYKEGVVPLQRLDESRAARDAAAGHARAMREQWLRAKRGLPEEDKAAAAAQVQVAQAGLQAVQALEKDTQLLAPADGEISQRMVQPGELVPMGFPIMTMIEAQHPWVSLNVRENQLHGLTVGRELEGTLPALDNQRVRFKVHTIGAQGEFATWRATRQSSGYDVRSFEVKLHPVQPVPALRPGMSVLFDWPKS